MHDNPFEERFLVIAEKPSVAMTIAATLGCTEKKDGYLEGPDCVVSWCFGHLAEYALPETYDEKYAKWSLDDLPIIPDRWKLIVPSDKAKQFRILCDLLNNRANIRKQDDGGTRKNFLEPFDYVVNACDCGREGELIFNRVYELSGSKLPVRRLWISSMEDEAIMNGFLNLRDGAEMRNLADASVCRAQADWLVGINASRAYTKVYDCRLTVGRVQTPTLAMLVKRHEEINSFQKSQYFITHLIVDSMGHTIDAVSERFDNREEANRLAGICSTRVATVPSIERQTRTVTPPKLYDLTSLQRDANRLFGLSASKTLACVQNLYENKLITYPRTDSRFLTDDMEKTALDVISASRKAFPFLDSGESASASYEKPDVRRLLDSKKVTDHHAIIPTVRIRNSDLSQYSTEEKNILTLIATRLLCACGENWVYENVKASFYCGGYTFTATGRTVKEEGWRAVEAAMRRCCRIGSDANHTGGKSGHETRAADGTGTADDTGPAGEDGENSDAGLQDLSTLYQGAQFLSVKTKVTDHWTRPPRHYTEDTLLHAMETAGASEMEDDVERKGLGTPATRASIIDKLVASNYVTRSKRQLIATEAGKQLVTALPDYLKSAQMTTDWENRLLQIERGQYTSQTFMDGITQLINHMLQDCRQLDESERKRFAGNDNTGGRNHSGRESLGKCPACGAPVYEGEKNFYCSDRTCRFVLWKESRYLSRMRAHLTASMVRDLLKNGRTTVRDLYSPKKDKYYTADILLEWKNSKTVCRLDFPQFN